MHILKNAFILHSWCKCYSDTFQLYMQEWYYTAPDIVVQQVLHVKYVCAEYFFTSAQET
jgi:hypothetical protein